MKVGITLPSEQVLSAQLGVSRTVAREAMRALAALQIGNGRRARVAPMNAEAMSILLGHTIYSGQLSAGRAPDAGTAYSGTRSMRRSDDQVKELLEIVDQKYTALRADQSRIMEFDIRFHALIARASGKALYERLVGIVPRRVCRKLFCLSYAAMPDPSRAA